VRGRLSELGRVAARRYNLALSVALGQHMDAVVVDDRAAAFAAVDWLKRNRCGWGGAVQGDGDAAFFLLHVLCLPLPWRAIVLGCTHTHNRPRPTHT
jgi:hypothetical protein